MPLFLRNGHFAATVVSPSACDDFTPHTLTLRMTTHQEISALLGLFDESLAFWTQQAPQFADILPAKVAHPLEELTKLAKLVKAHTTKVGIVYKRENIKNTDYKAQFSTTEQLMGAAQALVTVLAQLKGLDVPQFYSEEMFYLWTRCYLGLKQLVGECRAIVDGEDADSESDARLVSVGVVWELCDSVTALLKGEPLVLLTEKISESLGQLDDGYEDFKEWAENPETVDFDDMFDDFDGSDSEPEKPPVEELDLAKKDGLRVYAQRWTKKIDWIRILVGLFKKLVPKVTKPKDLDEIYGLQTQLVRTVDRFITDLMLEQSLDDELKEHTKLLESGATRLARLGQLIHNEKKAKWYTAWLAKFNEEK